MDSLINQISAGVGKRRKKRSVLFLCKKRTRCVSFPSYSTSEDDSSDEDFCPSGDVTKPIAKKPITVHTQRLEQPKNTKRRFKMATRTTSSDTSPVPDGRASINSLPVEILLKIFQLAINNNMARLKLLLSLSKVCSMWREIAADSSLWSHLDLSFGWVKSVNGALLSLGEDGRLDNLEVLSVAGNSSVNPACIKALVERFPKLKSLDISRCKNIRLEGMHSIQNGFPHLQALSACNMNSSTLSQSLVGLIHSHRDTLQQVEVSGICWAPATLMTEISMLERLTKLDISDTVLPGTTSFIEFLRKHGSTLQILRASNCGFNTKPSDDVTTPIPFPELVEFSAAGTECAGLYKPDIGIFIKLAPKLKYLDIRGWKEFTLTALCDGSLSLPSLYSLNLADVVMCPNSTNSIQLSWVIESLRELDISRMKGLSDSTCKTMFSSLCSNSSSNTRLTALHCSSLPVTAEQLRLLLKTCKQLELLDLTACRELDRGWKKKYGSVKEVNQLRHTLLDETSPNSKFKLKKAQKSNKATRQA